MTAETEARRLTPDELRTLFLFESLTDEQLQWLSDAGYVESYPEGLVFNEGDPGSSVTDGMVQLSAAAPDQAEITGRLLNPMGQRVPNARVTLTDTTGAAWSRASDSAADAFSRASATYGAALSRASASAGPALSFASTSAGRAVFS